MDILQWGAIPIILLYIIYPLQGGFSKVALQSGPSTTFVAALLLLLSGFMWVMGLLTKSPTKKLEFWDWILLFQGMFLGLYIRYLASFWALQYLKVGKVYFLFLLAPFFTAFFAKICGTEILSSRKILSLFIGVFGFIPVVLIEGPSEASFESFYAFNLPEIVLIAGIAGYAYNWVIIKRLLVERKHSLWRVNAITMLGAGIALMVTAFFHDGWYKGIVPITQFYPFLGYIILVTCIAAFCITIHSLLLKKFSATLVAFFCLIEPFVASIYGYVLLGEPISWILIPSLGVVSIGLYLFYQDELQTEKK